MKYMPLSVVIGVIFFCILASIGILHYIMSTHPFDKPLVVEFEGVKLNSQHKYSIWNPNGEKVIAEIVTICEDGEGKTVITNKDIVSIEAKSRAYRSYLDPYWYTNCPEGSTAGTLLANRVD